MKYIYFLIMRMCKKGGKLHDWAYFRCFRQFVNEDPEVGFWEFSERYLAAMK